MIYGIDTKIVVGFDVSSACIGWSALKIEDKTISYVDSGIIEPTKDYVFDSLINVRTEINNVLNKNNPSHIAIEDLVQFMKGKSSANTIIKLTTYNRAIGLVCTDYLNRNFKSSIEEKVIPKFPQLFNVLKIRHGIKLDKKLPAKEDIPELVAKRLNINFPYYYNRKTKTKPQDVIHTTSYDRADGIAVALYYSLSLIAPEKKKK